VKLNFNWKISTTIKLNLKL